MKRAMVLSTITVLACLTVTTAVNALPATQEGQQMSRLIDANDPEAMRSLLLAWLRTAEMVHGIEPRGSREIESMSPEVMAELLRQIPERERFAEALVRETASLEAALARGARRGVPGGTQADAREALLAPFSPSYPPDSGGYKERILDPLRAEGLVTGPSTRCDDAAFGDKYNVWYPLSKAAEGAGAACTVASCDPIGIACAITCAVVEGVRIAALIAGLSIEVCDVHDGAVDSAEIEAAYRNGVAALDQLASVESLTRDLGVQIAETRANDDRNRDLILSNADLNRSAIVANDNANRDAIVANDNVNRDVIKAELDALGAAGVERDIMTALGRRECHSWMYTPAWADAARTVFLGGHLETMLLVTRKVIDQARLLGMVSARDLELAERGLAQVSAVAGDRPVPAGAICRDLLQAYRKATSVHP